MSALSPNPISTLTPPYSLTLTCPISNNAHTMSNTNTNINTHTSDTHTTDMTVYIVFFHRHHHFYRQSQALSGVTPTPLNRGSQIRYTGQRIMATPTRL